MSFEGDWDVPISTVSVPFHCKLTGCMQHGQGKLVSVRGCGVTQPLLHSQGGYVIESQSTP